jgi:hypothetical protein
MFVTRRKETMPLSVSMNNIDGVNDISVTFEVLTEVIMNESRKAHNVHSV